MDNCTSEVMSCKPNELKVLLAMVKLSKNNIVDLHRKMGKLKEIVGLGDKSIETALTGLRKRGMLVKTGVPKAWFIDPSYFMKGYYKKIYEIARMIEEKDKYLLEKIADWEEEERENSEESKLQARWDNERLLQEDFAAQVKEVDRHTDSGKGEDE
jgi:hypothetical protein